MDGRTPRIRPVPRRGRARQRGVAIVSVLLVVMLVSTIIAGLFVREHVAIRSVANREALAQSRWIERMAIDWGRFVLSADRRQGTVDHLGELWATRVDETVLDETVTAGARMEQLPRLQGQVTDAQGLFNLNNLVGRGADGAPKLNAVQIAAFRRLLASLDLPESLADLLAQRLLQSIVPAGGGTGVAAPRLLRLDELRLVRGFDPATIARLQGQAVFLPTADLKVTTVNLNTATAEVLAAYTGQDPAVARQWVDRRENTFYSSVQDAKARLGLPADLDASLFSVSSEYFLVRGVVRFGRIENELVSLLHRGSNKVTVEWQHRF